MRLSTTTLALLAVVMVAGSAHAGVLSDVKARGTLICGVNPEYAGFSTVDKNGEWVGFNVDICRAIAAAVDVKPEFVSLQSNERFLALASGKADVLAMQNTETMTRDTSLGVMFPAITYYDTQSIMTSKDVGAKSVEALDGASACVISGSTAETAVAELFKAKGLTYTAVTFKGGVEARQAYGAKRCDFIMGDSNNLARMRTQLPNPAAHTILDVNLARSPLGLAVRQGDDQWYGVVKWTFNALVAAEFYGITQSNVEQIGGQTKNAEIRRIVGAEGDLGKDIGLDPKFAVRAIKAVGNYGEIFARNIGPNTPMGLKRGLNALWTDGGLQYSPQFQ